jgi:hypothetical protein
VLLSADCMDRHRPRRLLRRANLTLWASVLTAGRGKSHKRYPPQPCFRPHLSERHFQRRQQQKKFCCLVHYSGSNREFPSFHGVAFIDDPLAQAAKTAIAGRDYVRKDDLVHAIMSDFRDTKHRNPMFRGRRCGPSRALQCSSPLLRAFLRSFLLSFLF